MTYGRAKYVTYYVRVQQNQLITLDVLLEPVHGEQAAFLRQIASQAGCRGFELCLPLSSHRKPVLTGFPSKQSQSKTSASQTSKSSPHRVKHTLCASIDEYILVVCQLLGLSHKQSRADEANSKP